MSAPVPSKVWDPRKSSLPAGRPRLCRHSAIRRAAPVPPRWQNPLRAEPIISRDEVLLAAMTKSEKWKERGRGRERGGGERGEREIAFADSLV